MLTVNKQDDGQGELLVPGRRVSISHVNAIDAGTSQGHIQLALPRCIRGAEGLLGLEGRHSQTRRWPLLLGVQCSVQGESLYLLNLILLE